MRNRHNSSSTMERKQLGPCQTGTISFVEELKKRTFRRGEEILQVMTSEELTLDYLIEKGFSKPIVINGAEGLDLKVPPLYNWNEFEEYLGSDRRVEVIDVEKQNPCHVDFSTFIKNMTKTKRNRTLNLISLECSGTRLGPMIEPPYIARKLDWVLQYWPDEEDEKRPRVQKYCLLSPKNSYTDFHVDFSGTSVWYHIVRGVKDFFVIRPTEANKSLFWNWSASSNRLYTFFGDQVDECFKCTLEAGSTLFLPTGWIHAVLTTDDSIVYGGNFLHSLNIEDQLKIYTMEAKTKTPERYLFPYFEDLHWLAAHGLLKELEISNRKHIVPQKYVLNGLKVLLINLKHWLPKPRLFFEDYHEANYFLREVGKQIRISERLIQLLNPPKPERESTRMRKKPVHEDFVDYTQFRKRTLRKPMKADDLQNPPDMTNENWHIMKGGFKVIIKKMEGNTDSPSTSGGLTGSINEDNLQFPLNKIIEKEVGKDDEGALQIHEFSTVQKSFSPLLNQHIDHPLESSGCYSPDLSREKLLKRRSSSQSTSENDKLVSELFYPCKKARRAAQDDALITTIAVVHQDDDYIYPSLEMSDSENDDNHSICEKDKAWNPCVKVGKVLPKSDRPSRSGKQKPAVEKGLEAAAASDYVAPKVSRKKKTVRPFMRAAPSLKSSAINQVTTPSTPSKTSNKTKKGLKTPKQRLGKILKLHKMAR